EVGQLHAGRCNGGEVAIGKEEQVARVIEDCRNIAGDEILVFAEADDGRRPIARGHNLVRLVSRNDSNSEDASQQLHGFADRFFQRRLVSVVRGEVLLDEVCDHLGVSLGTELVALFDQLSLQADIVLDDAVMDDNDLSGAVAVRVGILLGRTPVCGPARVADAVGAVERLQADDLFQVAQLALGAPHLQAVTIAANRNAGGVIAAIFEATQAIKDDRYNAFIPNVSNNAAHSSTPVKCNLPLRTQERVSLASFGRSSVWRGSCDCLILVDLMAQREFPMRKSDLFFLENSGGLRQCQESGVP